MKMFGKIKSFPIFMKIGRSERSHIEMIILEYKHLPMTDKEVISDTIYMFMKIISLEPYVDQSFFFSHCISHKVVSNRKHLKLIIILHDSNEFHYSSIFFYTHLYHISI